MACTELPSALRRPFDPDVMYWDRIAIWKRWEAEQWAAAMRHRGLSVLYLEPEMQRRILARIEERPPVQGDAPHG